MLGHFSILCLTDLNGNASENCIIEIITTDLFSFSIKLIIINSEVRHRLITVILCYVEFSIHNDQYLLLIIFREAFQ